MTQHVGLDREQAEWELHEQEIKEALEIYQWQIRVGAWGAEKSGRYLLNGTSIFVVLMGLLVGWLTIRGDDWTGFWVSNSVCLFVALYARFLWFADYYYHYHLTEKGIYYTQQQVISEAAYTVVRATAWVGIAICVLAAALIGPLAFVGAGAFALMSFSMTNFSAKVSIYGIYFGGSYNIVHLKNQEVIELDSSDVSRSYYSGRLYCAPDEKSCLFEQLQSVLSEAKVIEVKRPKELLTYDNESSFHSK
ncbi:hypothetical protein [Vibrio spartinae]|uniref:Uncharacterized protein n=1 Tax=Vibrio spartinae TaxID=1918945 RepID=A0ABX6QUY9_9VIBR|nr:hypothetical protein [Vibrio spartinae]QMV12836.1 hypothetical protein Vspart_00028 [Vibrio spartinae]